MRNGMMNFIGAPRLVRLQLSKEVDHGGADLRRTFLLGPMSATRQHDRRPELGDPCRLPGDVLGKSGGDKIAVTRHVERGNGHRRTSEGSQQFPAAIYIAPPGKGAMESALREFRHVNIDVRPVTQAGKDTGLAKRLPFRGIIPPANPPPSDGGLSPESA